LEDKEISLIQNITTKFLKDLEGLKDRVSQAFMILAYSQSQFILKLQHSLNRLIKAMLWQDQKLLLHIKGDQKPMKEFRFTDHQTLIKFMIKLILLNLDLMRKLPQLFLNSRENHNNQKEEVLEFFNNKKILSLVKQITK